MPSAQKNTVINSNQLNVKFIHITAAWHQLCLLSPSFHRQSGSVHVATHSCWTTPSIYARPVLTMWQKLSLTQLIPSRQTSKSLSRKERLLHVRSTFLATVEKLPRVHALGGNE